MSASSFFKLIFWLYLHSSTLKAIETEEFSLEVVTAACKEPLGMANGKIKDDQITVFSAYNSDFNTYGGHRARLNLTSWPPGHRSSPAQALSSWIKIELKENMIITGIATQGYGDPNHPEWVKQYMVLYSTDQPDQLLYFKNPSGGLMNFNGNKNWYGVVRNQVPIPTIVQGIMLMPQDIHNNFALRLELYGCKPGYYFIVSLKMRGSYFHTDYLNPKTSLYTLTKEDTILEVNYVLEQIPGFLLAKVIHFWPGRSPYGDVQPVVDVAIDCIEASVHYITTALQRSITENQDLFDPNYIKVKYPQDYMCRPPNVTITLKNDISEAKVVYTTQPLELEGKVKIICNLTKSMLILWDRSDVNKETSQLMNLRTFGSGKFQIRESVKDWSLGLHYIRLSVSMRGIEGTTNFDYGFINVTLPPLKLIINGPTSYLRGTGPFTLDASKSYDPSYPGKSLNYTWLCRRHDETFDNVNMSRFVDVEEPAGKGGCFGNGPGRINSTEPILKVHTPLLEAGQTYVFLVIVGLDWRESKIEHSVLINSSLTYRIRCEVNCGAKVTTSMRTVFSSSCVGTTCKSIKTYNWKLFYKDSYEPELGWLEQESLQDMLLTDLDSPSFSIKGLIDIFEGDALEEETEYKVTSMVTLEDGSAEKANDIYFFTNSKPYLEGIDPDEGCYITPEVGHAVTTEFNITCLGYFDDDLPLEYEFRYYTTYGMVSVARTYKNSITTRLPLGDASTNYAIAIEILVIDSLGASSMDFQPVTVNPMEAADVGGTLQTMTNGKDSAMGNLLQSGDVGKAAQMACAVLSLVDNSDANLASNDRKSGSDIRSKMSKDSVKKLKEGIINQITKVKVKSLQEVTQIAQVVAMATGQSDEISQDSQSNAIDLLSDTANFMASQTNANPEVMQKVGKSLLHGIGNLMSASSAEAAVKDENKRRPDKAKDAKRAKSKEMAKKTLNMMETVGSGLLSTKAVGEQPSVFKTTDVALLLDRQLPSKMGNKKLGEGDSGVALPSAGTLFGDKANMPVVDSQMNAFKNNPFTWDESSKNVKSSVVEFTLKVPGGKALEVKGLPTPIELYIPQKIQETPKNGTDPFYFAKPSIGEKNIRSHQITIKSEGMAVAVRIVPEEGAKLEVYVRHAKKPTPEEYSIKRIIPDYSTCTEFENGTYSNCTDDPFTLTLSSEITGGIGVQYIGVRYTGRKDTSSDLSAIEEDLARARRDCFSHNGRMKRACVGVKDPPTTVPPTPLIIIPKYNESTDVNYTMSVSVTACLYWSEKKSKWTSEGCKVGPNTVASKLHCLCNHLSAFGGDFFVAPNPIDFDKVFAAFGNLAETGNFVVLATCCGLFGLYFVGLVFARKADKRDETKIVANVVLSPEDLEDGYVYQISIQTGMWRGYGTTANVGIEIFGEDGKSDEIMLTDKNLNRNFFARGSINNFTIKLPEALGELLKIRIWHDNSGNNPAWFFHQVLVVDVQTAIETHFVANRWLAVEKGDGKIDIEIPKAEKKDLSGFKNLFYSRSSKSLGEGHLWLSVFTRPPHNTFTRCQRMSCCLSLLFAAMVTNAMFYQFGTEPKDTFQIGPLKMSWTQIKIGIQSSIVAIPVNILIVTIFKNVKYPVPENGEIIGSGDVNGKKAKTPGCLPHFFVYIGWILSSLTSLAAATFTVFYSLMWGASTSNQWLTSIMVSFFQDVIITQPIKVIAIASLLSLVLKKPPENDVVIGESLANEGNERDKRVKTPRGVELERQRVYRKKVIEMFRTLVEIIFFLIFILLVVVVCYGNRKVTRFQLTSGMEMLNKKFEKVTKNKMFWAWVKKELLPSLYDTQWYNGKAFEYEEGYLSNREVFIVGMPRLRQLRLRPDPVCIVEESKPLLSHMFHRCMPIYSHQSEFMDAYSMPGWKPVYNLTKYRTQFEIWKMCPKPWRYRSSQSLNSLPFQGKDLSYDGGGFVADLGYNAWQASDVVDDLEKNNWLDDKTAAVFVEFTVFEPSTSLFSHSKYLFERIHTGVTHAKLTVKTLVLYSSSDQNFQSFFQVCQLMLMLMILFFLFVEIGKVYRQGRQYCTQFWNWMELIQITSAVAAIVMFFFKEKYTSDFVKSVQENPYQTSSIDYIILWSDLEIYLLSLVIFVVTIKFLRLIRFNRSICQMTGTIVRSAKSMASFFILFIAVLLAFTQLGVLAFGATVAAYASFFQAMRAVLQMLLGGEMHFYELQAVDGFIGPAFTFVYMLSMTMILLNMFLAILNDSYEETREEENNEDFADADLCEFMIKYFSESLKVFAGELTNLRRKLFTIAQRYIKEKRTLKDEDYRKVPFDEPTVIVTFSKEDLTTKEECFLASVESMDDLLDGDEEDDQSLDYVKSSMTELRKSLMSLRDDQVTDKLSPMEVNLVFFSPKWDSPSNEESSRDAPVITGSIFDRQTQANTGSIFDRPTYANTGSIFDRPDYKASTLFESAPSYKPTYMNYPIESYRSVRTPHISSLRMLNHNRSINITACLSGDEDTSTEKSKLLGNDETEPPKSGHETSISVEDSEPNEESLL